MKYIIVQEGTAYLEYPIEECCQINGKEYYIKNGQLFQGNSKIVPYTWMSIDGRKLYYLEEEHKSYEMKDKLFISGEDGDIQIRDSIARVFYSEGHLNVEDGGKALIYLNQEKIRNGVYPLSYGDVLFIDGCRIVFEEKKLKIWGEDFRCTLIPTLDRRQELEHFSYYKRSPRIIKRVESVKIQIDTLVKDSDKKKKGRLQIILPLLCMMQVAVVVGIIMQCGIFMLISVAVTLMTVIFSVVRYMQDKKKHKITAAKKRELYGGYLLEKKKEISRQYEWEKEAYHYNYPTVKEIADMVETCDSRIYERSGMDDDFLTFSVGHSLGRAKFIIDDKVNDLEIDMEDYQEEIKALKRRYAFIDKPRIVDLKKSHLGLAGEKSVIHEQLKNYIAQLAFAQSYHDVQFIAIYEKEYEAEFSWIRWFSHARLQGLNVLGLIHSEKNRDQILSNMQHILKERRQKVEEEKKEDRFLPHYIFIIDEPKMLMDHSIMEFLGSGQGNQLGFSIIYTSRQQVDLPENIETILLFENSEEGRLLLNEKEVCDLRLRLYRIGKTDMEHMARNLGGLIHEQG